MFHIGIDGGKRMRTAEHHGTARIFAGNEHIRKLKQRDHLSGRDIKSFVVRARCDIQAEIPLGITLFKNRVIEGLRGKVAVPYAGNAALAVVS